MIDPKKPPQRSLILNVEDAVLHGDLALPDGAEGLVVFAHGSGSRKARAPTSTAAVPTHSR